MSLTLSGRIKFDGMGTSYIPPFGPLTRWQRANPRNQVVDMHIGLNHLLKSTQGINLISKVSLGYLVSGVGFMEGTMERGL